jgi:hypothetical protein
LTFGKIIYSSDESDYVGFPPSACDYVLGIGLSFDFSGGANPFPVMADWVWSLSGDDIQPSYGALVSASYITISHNQTGDMATVNFANAVPGQTLFLNGPQTAATTCDACSASDLVPQGSQTMPAIITLNVTNPFAFSGSDTTIPQVLMQAIGKPSGGTYSWTATPTNRVSFNNPSTEVVQVKGVNPSSSPSDTTLTVNYSVGGMSAIPAHIAITVRVFELLNQTAPVSIVPQPDGFFATVNYNVLTGPGKQLLQPGFSGISVGENVTVTSATLNGVALTPQQLSSITLYKAEGATTDTNSEVDDNQSLLNNAGGPLPTVLVINLSQDLFVGSFYVRTNGIQKTSNPSVTIANNGPVIP